MTWIEMDTGEEFDREMRERLEDLGYIGGGHIYEFLTARRELSSLLDDIEDGTGLKFRDGADGHASLGGNTLRITSKKEIPDSQLKEIEDVC